MGREMLYGYAVRAYTLIENFEDSYKMECPFAGLLEELMTQLYISNNIEAEEAEALIIEAQSVAKDILRENKKG